jgi:hypothetical protein
MASRRPHSGSSQGWTGRFGRVAGAPKPTVVNGSRRTLRYRRMCDIDSGHELWTPDERTEGPLAWTVAETLGCATRWPPTPGLHRSARAVLHSLLHRTPDPRPFVAPCPSPDHANPRRDCRPRRRRRVLFGRVGSPLSCTRNPRTPANTRPTTAAGRPRAASRGGGDTPPSAFLVPCRPPLSVSCMDGEPRSRRGVG